MRIVGSNVEITRIGFGCARLFGGIEARASRRLIETALSVGIRHFDTAPAYGDSEALVGEVLAGVTDITIATKVGIPHVTDSPRRLAGIVYRRLARPVLSRLPSIKARLLRTFERNQATFARTGNSQSRRDLSQDTVLRSLDESLKRLKRGYIDILLLHEPDQFRIDDRLSALFESLRSNGVIGAFGLAYGRVADETPDFGTILQSQYAEEMLLATKTRRSRIVHGALRAGWNLPGTVRRPETVTEYLERILARQPDLSIIFSASSRYQIRKVVGKILEA